MRGPRFVQIPLSLSCLGQAHACVAIFVGVGRSMQFLHPQIGTKFIQCFLVGLGFTFCVGVVFFTEYSGGA